MFHGRTAIFVDAAWTFLVGAVGRTICAYTMIYQINSTRGEEPLSYVWLNWWKLARVVKTHRHYYPRSRAALAYLACVAMMMTGFAGVLGLALYTRLHR